MLSKFYTPVQKIRQIYSAYNQEELQRFSEDLFKITNPKIQSLEDTRKKLIQWYLARYKGRLKKMGPFERQLAVTVTHKQFTCLVRKMFQLLQKDEHRQSRFLILKDKNKQFYLEERKFFHKQKDLIKAQEQLISNIMIFSKYTHCDSISFSEELLENVDHFYGVLEAICNGVSQELSAEDSKLMALKGEDFLFFQENQDFQYHRSLGVWIADAFSKNISVNYFKYLSGEKGYDVEQAKGKIKAYSQIWKKANSKQKLNLIKTVTKQSIIELIQQHSCILRVQPTSFPATYINEEAIIRQSELTILNCPENLIYNSLLQLKLPQSFESFNYYKFELAQLIEGQILQVQDAEKKKPILKKKRTKKKGQSGASFVEPKIQINILSKDKNKLMTNGSSEISKKIKFVHDCDQKNSQAKKQSSFEEKINTQAIIFEQIQNFKKGQMNCQIEKKDKPLYKSTISSQTTNDQLEFEQIKSKDLFFKSQSNEKLFNDIYNQIFEQSQNLNKYRKIIFNRIAHILRRINLNCQIYGSYACGLAIKGSDLDISIDPAIVHYFYIDFCSYRNKMVKSLEYLKKTFEGCNWASDFILLPNASIPLLSFKAKPGIYFEHKDPSKLKLNLGKKSSRNEMQISVDLTIQPYANMTSQVCPHLGGEIVLLMKQWLANFALLEKLTLIFKHFLKKNNFHKPYTGGIGSFLLVVILVGFFKHRIAKNTNSNLLSANIDAFIDFFELLQKEKFLVDLRLHDPLAEIPKQMDQGKLMIFNPINGKNLAENCFKFSQICSMMKLLRAKNQKDVMSIIMGSDQKEF